MPAERPSHPHAPRADAHQDAPLPAGRTGARGRLPPQPLGELPGPGDIVADTYRIERDIGTGGMGRVVEAIHLELGERVAIKFLLPILGSDAHALERFEREARAVFQIRSEHVARVLDLGRLPTGTPYIVMELLEGETVAQQLAASHEFAIPEAVALVLEACEAIAEAHSLGIVHRDLKPENLFLTERADGSRCLKVLDFGLSKFAAAGNRPGPRGRQITGISQQMGTPNYMSPEQFVSARDAGPAADQWALGAILYELIAGAPAFGGDHLAHVAARVLEQPTPLLTRWRHDVPAALEQAVSRALEKDPAKRFPSLLELGRALQPFAPEIGQASIVRIARVLGQDPAAAVRPDATPSDAGAAKRSPAGQSALDSEPSTPRAKRRPTDSPATPERASVPDRASAPDRTTARASASALGRASAPDSASSTPSDREPETVRNWQRLAEQAPGQSRSRLLFAILGTVALVALVAAIAWALAGR